MWELGWWIAAGLGAAGILVSGYLLVSAIGGYAPACLVGACDRVVSGPYAQLLGLPMAAWGMLLYMLIAATATYGATRRRARATIVPALLGLALFGTTFSAYLMWLQLRVIGALCAWCATSAMIMTIVLVTAAFLVRATVTPSRS